VESVFFFLKRIVESVSRFNFFLYKTDCGIRLFFFLENGLWNPFPFFFFFFTKQIVESVSFFFKLNFVFTKRNLGSVSPFYYFFFTKSVSFFFGCL